MNAPMKPAESWAHVRRDTGEVTFLCDLDESEESATSMMLDGRRLARVVITEKEANHA